MSRFDAKLTYWCFILARLQTRSGNINADAMRLFDTSPQAVSMQRFGCFTTYSPALLREAQHLRYRVFADASSLHVHGGKELLECDDFDSFCEHLIVYDFIAKQVVGYARLLNEMQANLAGGFHAQTQFDLDSIFAMPGRFLEVGRICTDPAYRGGAVLSALWRGLARYVAEGSYNYLLGCISIPSGPGGFAVESLYGNFGRKNFAPPRIKVTPAIPVPAAMRCERGACSMPAQLKAYLRLGALVCGEPCWDRDGNVMEVFILLPLERIKDSYGKYYSTQGCAKDFRVTVQF
jgi:putative hemolysin